MMEGVVVNSLWMVKQLNVTQPQPVLAALFGDIVGFQMTTVPAVDALTIEIPVSVTNLVKIVDLNS